MTVWTLSSEVLRQPGATGVVRGYGDTVIDRGERVVLLREGERDFVTNKSMDHPGFLPE